MATVVRNTDPSLKTLCDAHNNVKTQIGAGSSFHLDASEVTITAASSDGTLATALALVNQEAAVYSFHIVDLVLHKGAESSAHPLTVSYPVATLTDAISLANNIKLKYNGHRADTGAHFNADSTNVVTVTNATSTIGQLDSLIDDIKTQLLAHVGSASAPASVAPSLRLVGA